MVGSSVWRSERISLPIRITGNYLYYNYAEGGETIDVRGPGCAAMTGIRTTQAWGSAAALAGGEIRWERRDRSSASGASSVVARGSVVAQIEGDFAWGRRLHPFLLVNYSGSARYTYGRVGLRWQVSNLEWRDPLTWSLGLEGVGQGNSDTDALQVGGAVECVLVRSRISLSVRGGYKDSASSDGGRRGGGYVGMGVYRRF
jgi:hypothetical protein